MYAFRFGLFGVGVLAEIIPLYPETGVSVDNQVIGFFEESILAVSQAAADLPHLDCIRARRDSGDLHTPCLHLHHDENIERDESLLCPDFHRREVRGKDRIPVSFEKCDS